MKRLLGNLLVLSVATALGFGLLEMAYRFYLFGWDAFSIEKVNSVNALGLSGLLQPSDEPDLVFELRPNVDTYFKLVPFRTNPKGMRDKDYPFEKAQGVFRVAVLGERTSMTRSGAPRSPSGRMIAARSFETNITSGWSTSCSVRMTSRGERQTVPRSFSST